MAFSKKLGKHFHNPSIMRQHEKDSAAKTAPDKSGDEGGQESSGPAHQVEIHHPDSPDNPSPGKFHTVTHGADGSEDHADHDTVDEATDHVGAVMGDGQDGQDDNSDSTDGDGDQDDIAGMDEADQEY